MARKCSVVSALQALTNNEFKPSDFIDNAGLQALVTEYVVDGSGETNDDVSSDEDEMCIQTP